MDNIINLVSDNKDYWPKYENNKKWKHEKYYPPESHSKYTSDKRFF